MPHTVKITKLVEGPRNAIFHVFLQGDGSSGDLTNQTIIDPHTDLSPVMNNVPTLTIQEIWWGFSGFNMQLKYDNLVSDTPVWVCNQAVNYVNLNKFGGLKDRSSIDGTGKLQISTSGLTPTTSQGSFVITVRKD